MQISPIPENYIKFYENLQILAALVGGEDEAKRLYDNLAGHGVFNVEALTNRRVCPILNPADAVQSLIDDYLAGKIK